mmetsp:Transcript_24669/g.37256  ORF Transcript_24669/g.37256 Transcript_24669/m.37256 type:complete len:124 (-) Transcript_24669:293-664(-)
MNVNSTSSVPQTFGGDENRTMLRTARSDEQFIVVDEYDCEQHESKETTTLSTSCILGSATKDRKVTKCRSFRNPLLFRQKRRSSIYNNNDNCIFDEFRKNGVLRNKALDPVVYTFTLQLSKLR